MVGAARKISPALSSMPAIEAQPHSRKRRTPFSESLADQCFFPLVKKRKSSGAFHHNRAPSPGFWDRLSLISLSRQALREFDRRTKGQHPREDSILSPRELPCGPRLLRLKRFARCGGPSLTHLRGFADLPAFMSVSGGPSQKRSSTSSRTRTTKSSKTTPYSGQYDQGLIDAHVYPEGHDYDNEEDPTPNNYEDIQRKLAVERASLSPSRFTQEDFKNFKRTSAQARGETRMMQKALLDICGRDDRFKTAADVEFNRIQPFNKDLAAAKPDLYDGVQTSKIHKRVRDQLATLVVPSTNSTNPVAPNFFLEGKSEKGRADVAKKQACHDGAIGARAMHSLQNYGAEKIVYDGNAYSFTNTYHNGLLRVYTTHMTKPRAAGEQPDYHMTLVKGFDLTSDRETFQKGATFYRNARDLASTQRNRLIEQANERVSLEGDLDTSSGSDTSVDEVARSAPRSKRPRHGEALAQPP